MTGTQLQYSPQVRGVPAPEFSLPISDKDGRVRWSNVEAKNSERRENAEILTAIKLLS